jgi:hypothetical protein
MMQSPPRAGFFVPARALKRGEMRLIGARATRVIPAKAGIHLQATPTNAEEKMDAGLRRHDAVPGANLS